MIKKNDFIEVEFTGKISGTDEIFDTNIESDAKKANLNLKDLRPFILSVGHKMLPQGFDDDLIGKETGKKYIVQISPEKAFGKRNKEFVRMVPTKLFYEQKINPQAGMQLALDGQLVKILSSSGGRTLVDFNNPLAGKNINYEYNIKRVVSDTKEKIDALQDFLFRKRFDFEIEGNVVKFKIEKELEPIIKIFSKKFEEVLQMKIESKIVAKEEKKVEKTSEIKNKVK